MANMEKIYIYIYTHHLSGTYEYFYLWQALLSQENKTDAHNTAYIQLWTR